jgi:uracil-DNA glycosylase
VNINFDAIHPTWQRIVADALKTVDPSYLNRLKDDKAWLPGHQHIFKAFSLPLSETRYILFGESPYPRSQSANGYAFWDAAVEKLWSDTGLSKAVNRATSLRNFIKMLLVSDSTLSSHDVSQAAIAALDKRGLVNTAEALFQNIINQGILLLNASLVLSSERVSFDAKAWRPFIECLLAELHVNNPAIQLILFGNIAKAITELPSASGFDTLTAEHPYNISFIHNPRVLEFFQPMHLLKQPE